MRARFLQSQGLSFYLYDSFGGAYRNLDGKPVESGGLTWSSFSFPVNTSYIDNGAGVAVQNTSDSNARFAVLFLPVADSRVYLRMAQHTGSLSQRARLLFNYVDASNYWGFTASGSTNGDYFLFQVVGGTTTVRQTRSGDIKSNGDTWRVEATGDQVTTYVNDVLVHDFFAIGRPLKTGTGVGIGFGSSTPIETTIDEFGAY